MKIVKSCFLILCAFTFILIFTLSNLYLWKSVSKFQYSITDISGDRSCLKDIKIGGVIYDSNQQVDFKIQDNNGIVKSKSILHAFGFSNIYRLDGHSESISVSDDIQYEYIEKWDGKVGYGITCGSRIGYKREFTTCTDQSTGKSYAYTLTGYDYTGIGGAYDVTDLIKSKKSKSDPTKLKNISPTAVNGSTRIIGMEAAGNVLLFITEVNKQIVLKPYDISEQKFLSDIKLRSNNYPCYVGQSDNSYISLCFPVYDDTYTSQRLNIVVYDTKTNKLVSDTTKVDHKALYLSHDVEAMKYKNNKLYILQAIPNPYSSKYQDKMHSIITIKISIIVIENNEILYRGIMEANANDDLFMGDPDKIIPSTIRDGRNFYLE